MFLISLKGHLSCYDVGYEDAANKVAFTVDLHLLLYLENVRFYAGHIIL